MKKNKINFVEHINWKITLKTLCIKSRRSIRSSEPLTTTTPSADHPMLYKNNCSCYGNQNIQLLKKYLPFRHFRPQGCDVLQNHTQADIYQNDFIEIYKLFLLFQFWLTLQVWVLFNSD